MLLRFAAGAVAASTLLAPGSALAGSTHVFAVRGDVKIGSFAVRADGSLGGAVDAFGVPTSRRHTYGPGTCTAVWARHGPRRRLSVLPSRGGFAGTTFQNAFHPGSANPCA